MTPTSGRRFILGFLGALGLIAGLLFLARPERPVVRKAEPLDTHPVEAGRILGVDPAAAIGSRPLPAAPVPATRIQVPLERPAPGPSDVGLRALRVPEAIPSGPVDKRGNPGPNAARQMEIIRYAFETLEEDVRACLEQWESSAPGEATEVMIAFEIDAAGLQKTWLEHQTEVPFGPRTCLANAVYGLDWSKIVDQPAKLTQRFELGRKDAR